MDVTVTVDELGDDGFAIEWAYVKDYIDDFDHKLILADSDSITITQEVIPAIPNAGPVEQLVATRKQTDTAWVRRTTCEPSTEALAQLMAEELARLVLDKNSHTSYAELHVTLSETDSIMAYTDVRLNRDRTEGYPDVDEDPNRLDADAVLDVRGGD